MEVGIGPRQSRVAMMSFAKEVEGVFQLTGYGLNEGWHQEPGDVPWKRIKSLLKYLYAPNDLKGFSSRGTYVAKGLNAILEKSITYRKKNAVNDIKWPSPIHQSIESDESETAKKKLVVVLTDGDYTSQDAAVQNAAKKLLAVAGTTILAIGIEREGQILNQTKLTTIAGGNSAYTMKLTGFNALKTATNFLKTTLCNPTNPPERGPDAPAVDEEPEECDKPVDLTFVVDASSSIEYKCKQTMPNYKCGIWGRGESCPKSGTANDDACWPECPGYNSCWPQMKYFINKMQNQFKIGKEAYQSRVSLLTFSNAPAIHFVLNSYDTNNKVGEAIDELNYELCTTKNRATGEKGENYGFCKGGEAHTTDTSAALTKVKESMLTEEYGMRAKDKGVTRIVVVVTDGESNDKDAAKTAATALRKDGVIIIAVGVSLQAGSQTMIDLVGDDNKKDRIFSVNNFGSLAAKIKEVTAKVCEKAVTVEKPVVALTTDAAAGDINLDALGTAAGFVAGDQILIGANTEGEEANVIAKFVARRNRKQEDEAGEEETVELQQDFQVGSIILANPLIYDHPASTEIRLECRPTSQDTCPEISANGTVLELENADPCDGADDGYKWSLAISATLKMAERPFSVDASQLTINSDGTGGMLNPDQGDELTIDAKQLAQVTDSALRLRGEIGFSVQGKACRKDVKGRFSFGLPDDAVLMNVFGAEFMHLKSFSFGVGFQGTFPFMESVVALGQIYIGDYGSAAACILTESNCGEILQLDSSFIFSKDDAGDRHFELGTYLVSYGGDENAMLDLHKAVADGKKGVSEKKRKTLALLASVDFGVSVKLVLKPDGGGAKKIEIKLDGALKKRNLPTDSPDDPGEGNCNVVCQYLHKAIPGGGSAEISAEILIEDKADGEGKDTTVSLSAKIKNKHLTLTSGDGSAPKIVLINLGFATFFTTKSKQFELQLTADIDVNENIKLEGGIGFFVAKDAADGETFGLKFAFGLREPWFKAFGKEVTHLTDFQFDLLLTGSFPFISSLSATGSLCLGLEDPCRACTEVVVPEGDLRSSIQECIGPVYVDIRVQVRIAGSGGSVGEDSGSFASASLLTGKTCPTEAKGGGDWECSMEAHVESSTGGGALSRSQKAVSGDEEADSSNAADERLGVFSTTVFVLKLTLGPSRFALSAEAQLLKGDLPPETEGGQADDKSCDMLCRLCHKVLAKAEEGSFIFVKGEIAVTIQPFSLSVGVGAGFSGAIEFEGKGITLTEAGILFTFSMAPKAIEFEAKVYGAIELGQRKTFGPNDGVVVDPTNGDITFTDASTHKNGAEYGSCTNSTFQGK
jgi:hypothetical protein